MCILSRKFFECSAVSLQILAAEYCHPFQEIQLECDCLQQWPSCLSLSQQNPRYLSLIHFPLELEFSLSLEHSRLVHLAPHSHSDQFCPMKELQKTLPRHHSFHLQYWEPQNPYSWPLNKMWMRTAEPRWRSKKSFVIVEFL